MIHLYNKDTNAMVGSITDAEMQLLDDHLERESDRDTDYYFSTGTVDLLAENGQATDHLLKLLRDAIGTSEGVELRWERQ
jgi:hypothetical protein